MSGRDHGVITVVLPVRDEASTVAAALESLATQTIGAERIEVLVYDGQSRDGTADVCRRFAHRADWHHFAVVTNGRRTVPHALNAGLERARGTWFTRLDGRTAISPNYLEACIQSAARRGSGTAVGGCLLAEANGDVAESIAAVVTHRLGVGTGFRIPARTEREVSHHPFAVWRTAEVRAHGGFRADLARNQDDEFSMRARGQGARIFVLPEAVVRYRPRERLRGLGVQYFQYGLWKVAVARSDGQLPVRSLAPAAVVLGTAGAAAAALLGRSSKPLALGAGAYACAGTLIGFSRSGARLHWTIAALATAHLSYGAGILSGVLRPSLVHGAAGHGRAR